MTCREKLAIEHPDEVHDSYEGGCRGCPNYYGYLEKPVECRFGGSISCTECWDREIPEVTVDPAVEKIVESMDDETFHKLTDRTNVISAEALRKAIDAVTVKPHTDDVAFGRIKDSGNRREFDSGAVRDMAEGKGRCDLMPLDVVASLTHNKVISHIYGFMFNNDILRLEMAIKEFVQNYTDWCGDGTLMKNGLPTMLLEVAKHFEEGCKKYGENNWRKGIPVKFYIDSAVRHYLKYLRGDKDEPHDRAFCWNILCAIWTHNHKPELRINPTYDDRDRAITCCPDGLVTE